MERFRILGPIEVWADQGWTGIGAPKWRALLATLLLNPGQAVSTGQLIAELWGDQPPDRASNLVSVYVLGLRRLLGDSDRRVLMTTRAPGYQLVLGPGDLDAGRFEALVGQGRQAHAAGSFRRAADVLAEALALWRGRALSDVPPSELVTAEAGWRNPASPRWRCGSMRISAAVSMRSSYRSCAGWSLITRCVRACGAC